jgi:hypothetical protein
MTGGQTAVPRYFREFQLRQKNNNTTKFLNSEIKTNIYLFLVHLIFQTSDDALDSGTESDDETGGPDDGKKLFFNNK